MSRERFEADFAAAPIVAVLRGITPAEAEGVGAALIEAGIRVVEVPLGSPDALRTIERLAIKFGAQATIGGGTVLSLAEIDRLADIGAGLVVAPNCDPAVVRRAGTRGMAAIPGVLTPTEALAALDAGATALKLFPAEMVPAAAYRLLLTVLPAGARLLPFSSVTAATIPGWLVAGAPGFGIGSALYRPGRALADIAAAAREIVGLMRDARSALQPSPPRRTQ